MQDKEPNVSKHTSDIGCQVNLYAQRAQLMIKSSETHTYWSSFEVIPAV